MALSAKSFIFSVFWGLLVFAAGPAWADGRLLAGTDGREITLIEAISGVRPGDIIVIGEEHGNAACQAEQLRILQALRDQGLSVSVGMEFLEYPFQSATDLYRAGQLLESDFLKTVQWGQGFPFDFYRDQILFPRAAQGESTRALNAPRKITGKVAKQGIGSLTPEERAELPSGLTRGNDRYFERFKEAIGHLPNPDAAENYFWAQSIWDETMAWKTLEFAQAHPAQVFVVIVGEFHVQYGGGLPSRLRARGAGKVWTFSQVGLTGLDPSERDQAILPSPLDGPRADFVWAFEEASD